MDNNPVLLSISSGIIAGLVTGILIWLFRNIWLSILEPRVRDLLYRGIRIDGIWQAQLIDAESNHKEEIKLIQKGHFVSGTMKCIEGQDQGSEYTFKGTFKNLIISAEYEINDKSSVDRGTFTLKLKDNGAEFIGATAYYGATDGEVSAVNYEWKRS